MKFTEEKLEHVIIELLGQQSYPHTLGENLQRQPEEVVLRDDFHAFLNAQYAQENLTTSEIDAILHACQVPICTTATSASSSGSWMATR